MMLPAGMFEEISLCVGKKVRDTGEAPKLHIAVPVLTTCIANAHLPVILGEAT